MTNFSAPATTPQSESREASQVPKPEGHIIICGLQSTGYRVLEQLIKAELETVVIDQQSDPRFVEMAKAQGIKILSYDSRTEFGLRAAGITSARAIIALTDNDLHNLETILTACEIAPKIRAVASFYNQQIGNQLIKSIPTAQTFSISELVSSNFVTVSLPSPVLHLFELNGEEMAVIADRVDKSGSSLSLYGPAVTPIARRRVVYHKDGSTEKQPSVDYSTLLCPPPNTALNLGDTVTLVGPVSELLDDSEVRLDAKQLELARYGAAGRKGRRARNSPSLLTYIKGLLAKADRPLKTTLLASSLVIIIGIIAFLIEKPGSNLVDALYNTMITIGSNYSPDENDTWVFKLFCFFLILVGTALLGVIYGYITNFIVTTRIAQVLGREKATHMQNHVVLVGLGSIGYTVLKGLVERGENVVVIEKNEQSRFVALARHMKVPIIHADSRVVESLNLVNIDKARCITILTNDDLINLETALNARSRNPTIRVVMRLFDQNLADRTEKTFNIEIARSTSALAAPYFIAAALNLEVITSFYAEQTPFCVAKMTVKEGSNLSRLKLRDMYTRAGVKVIAYVPHPVQITTSLTSGIEKMGISSFEVKELTPVFNPNPEHSLEVGDILYFVGPYERITSAYSLNS
jgi:Trk K+ transport system NAD-binding subunit